jgi:hypothetical protein
VATQAVGDATTTAAASATPTSTGSRNTTAVPTAEATTTLSPAVPRLIIAFVRIRGSSFGALLSNSTQRARLLAAVAADIARALGVDPALVVVTDMRLGSLLVNFTVVRSMAADASGSSASSSSPAAASTQLSAEALSAALTAAASDSTWLTDTSALYAAEANATEALQVESASSDVVLVSIPSTPPTGSPPTTSATAADGGCGGRCMAFYGAAAIAVVAIVGVAVGVVLYSRKRSEEKSAPAVAAPTDKSEPYAA